ncbi:MAG: hypothetical protein JW955_24465 [Sedimentisphaerales bacterium]|nr:hypothetical protein [Sedimentisphaerales bacterium]
MDNDRAIGDCILRAASLRRYSEQIENEEFPCDEPIHLAKALANIAQALAEYLVHARSLPSYNAKQGALEIRAIDGIVKWLFEPLRYVEGAVTSKVPWSLVGPLQSITTRLLPGTALILRPKWRYNYAMLMSDIIATIKEPAKKVLSLEQINKCFGELKPPLHVISFPYIERRSVFLHAALGHEVGHLIAEEFIRDEKTPMPAYLALEIIKRIQDDKAVAPLFKSKEIIRQLRECAEYRQRAIQELGSDLVAVNIMGFAALFALDSIVGMRNLDDVPSPENQRYPPARRRIRLMLEEVEQHLNGLVNWDQLEALVPIDGKPVVEAYKKRIEELQAIAASADDAKALGADKTVEIAYRWVDQSLNDLRPFVRKRCEGVSEAQLAAPGVYKDGKAFARGSGFWLQACDLATSRLGSGLPPNTNDDTVTPSRPASFEAIMNAGWLHLLSSVPSRPESVASVPEFVKRRQRVERLTLRALELSDVQVMYNRWRQQHGRPGQK